MIFKTAIRMGVAVVCGLGASYLTIRLVAGRQETASVLVARQNQRAFTLIKDPVTLFARKEIPCNQVPKNAVVNLDDLKDRFLVKEVAEGQPVVADDLEDKDGPGPCTGFVPGNRCVTIVTDAAGWTAGSVLPGSHVDVYHTPRSGERPEARLLLSGVLVLVVDCISPPMPRTPGELLVTVTLEVTIEQAMTLATAMHTGSFTLAMAAPRRDEATPVEKTPALPSPPRQAEQP